MRPPVRIRDYKPEDLGVVIHAWLLDYRRKAFKRGIVPPVYYIFQERKIKALMDRHPPVIACDMEDEDHVYGWACGAKFEHEDGIKDSVLHYVYVKEAFRGQGVASLLIKEFEPWSTLFYTHETSDSKLIQRYMGIFNPYLSEGNT